MPAKNALKGIMNLFNLSSEEELIRPARRATEIDHLSRPETPVTTFDPTTGRKTVKTMPGGFSTPAGHFVSDLGKDLLGECCACRQEFDDAGEPHRITLVPRGDGGGGLCKGCLSVFCPAHGSCDEEGYFWCEECGHVQKAKQLKAAIIDRLFRKQAKDE